MPREPAPRTPPMPVVRPELECLLEAIHRAQHDSPSREEKGDLCHR